MAHGDVLVRFAAAVVGTDTNALTDARAELAAALGPDAVVTAAITAANFSMLDRVANAVGTPVDDMIVKPTADFRAALGINEYPSAANTPAN